MNNISDKKYIRLLIILSVLTLVIWNNEIFLTVINSILPGDVMNQSILSRDNSFSILIFMLTFFTMPFLPLIPLIYCSIKLIKNKRSQNKIKKHQRNWIIIILALNILFCVLFGVFWLNSGHPFYQYPDLSNLRRSIERLYVNNFIKNDVSEYVLEYLKDKYGGDFSFSIKSAENSISRFSDERHIVYTIRENNLGFYFVIAYDIDSETIHDDFRRMLAHQKVNLRMKELIDVITGEGRILHVRWDWILGMFSNDIPTNATADDIIAGKYGRLSFDPIIFVLVDNISLNDAKEMYLAILRDFCFLHMTPDNESQTPQMKLGDARFWLCFVSTEQYEQVWANNPNPGEGDSFNAKYASIGYGMSLRHFADDYHDSILDINQIYEAAKQYLDENYIEKHW